MNDDSAAIDQGLSELASLVAARLSDEGWHRRELDQRHVLVLTKPVGDGVFASVEVALAGFRWPQTWPETITVRFGAGYEPALDLMPLVTLRPWVSLARESDLSDEPALGLEIAGPDQIRDVATRLVTAIREHGSGFAEHCDVDTFEAALADRRQWPYALEAQLRPVLLASAGRREQARSALDRYSADNEADDDADTGGDDYQRFARQLRRWLDAGSQPAPPVEQTLRRLPPPPPRPQLPSWSRARQDGRDRAEARDAVRAVARGKTREQISELLAAEHAARGMEISPSTLAYGAEMIELEQRPLGKLRGLVRGLRMLKDTGTDAVTMVRARTAPDPEWMRPPVRATYPVATGRPYIAVTLNEDAEPVLARAAVDGTHRLGPSVLLTVWLDRADSDPGVHVHLGAHEIGTLPEDAARLFAVDLSAASELFDEALRVRATLTPASTPASNGQPPLLEIGTPKHAA